PPASVRHRHLRGQDAAPVRSAAPGLGRHSPPGSARRGSFIPHQQGAGMTREVDVVPAPDVAPSFKPGLILAAAILIVYGSLAVSIDFPRISNGIHSDEATYYMMGHSLAEDGDLTYHKEDLVRVWREFPSGPTGVFLKKGV